MIIFNLWGRVYFLHVGDMNLMTPFNVKINKQYKLYEGDAFEQLNKVDDYSVDLIISSPPYNLGKEYEKNQRLTLDEYIDWLDGIIEKLTDKVSNNGAICWQVGNFIQSGEVFPLDIYFYNLFKRYGFKLRNRIIWRYNFGLNASNRLSGRYETLLWFTKSDEYTFNLDAIRVPQLYPGKRHSASKGEKAGHPSCNPKGKNPSDYWEFDGREYFKENPVWDLPNVKSNHPEKTIHPCQFPIELVERCVLAFSAKGNKILDPFVGTGTTIIGAMKHDRIGLGIEKNSEYIKIANDRIEAFQNQKLKMRPSGKPVRRPRISEKVSQIPEEWDQK